MIETLLETRKIMKERKPVFIRQDNPKRMKLNYKWRKPKGIHSKIRHKFKGRRKMPSPGYKSPAKVKGLHNSGLKIVNISTLDQISKLNKDSEGAIVSRSVGIKKRIQIFKKAKELKIKILNMNLDEQIKKIEEIMNSKKAKSANQPKKEIQKEKSGKEAKEKKEEPKMSDESKKEAEKLEKDRLLTKRS